MVDVTEADRPARSDYEVTAAPAGPTLREKVVEEVRALVGKMSHDENGTNEEDPDLRGVVWTTDHRGESDDAIRASGRPRSAGHALQSEDPPPPEQTAQHSSPHSSHHHDQHRYSKKTPTHVSHHHAAPGDAITAAGHTTTKYTKGVPDLTTEPIPHNVDDDEGYIPYRPKESEIVIHSPVPVQVDHEEVGTWEKVQKHLRVSSYGHGHGSGEKGDRGDGGDEQKRRAYSPMGGLFTGPGKAGWHQQES